MRSHVFWASVDVALGRWTVARTRRGVCFLALEHRGARARLEAWRLCHAPRSELVCDPAALAQESRDLESYARGEIWELDAELDLRGSRFQLRVWRELRSIAYGTTHTYAEIARRIGAPGAARAVGGAAGKNPVPLYVPCHRVVAANGIGGFSGGLENKRRLLELEADVLFAS